MKNVTCGPLSHNGTLSFLLYVAEVATEAILAHKSMKLNLLIFNEVCHIK